MSFYLRYYIHNLNLKYQSHFFYSKELIKYYKIYFSLSCSLYSFAPHLREKLGIKITILSFLLVSSSFCLETFVELDDKPSEYFDASALFQDLSEIDKENSKDIQKSFANSIMLLTMGSIFAVLGRLVEKKQIIISELSSSKLESSMNVISESHYRILIAKAFKLNVLENLCNNLYTNEIFQISNNQSFAYKAIISYILSLFVRAFYVRFLQEFSTLVKCFAYTYKYQPEICNTF